MKAWAPTIAAVLAVALTGCNGGSEHAWEPPAEAHEGADSMMEGPGLFSGEDGALSVISTDIWNSERRRRKGTGIVEDED